MKKKIVIFLAIFSLTLLSSPGFTQERPPPPDDAMREDRSGNSKDRKRRHQEMEDKIRTVRLLRMVEALDLKDEKALAINNVLTQYDLKRKDLRKTRRQNMKEIQEQLRSESPEEGALTKSLQNLMAIEKSQANLKIERFQEVSKQLTPTQQAKFLVFEERFRRSVRDILRQKRRSSKGKNQEGRPGRIHDVKN